jgi:hypothetical protein
MPMRSSARTLALLACLLGAATAVARCSSDDTATSADAAADAPIDLCDLDAYSGSGNPCPYASPKLCFQQCDNGGCRCVASSKGPIWSCKTDFSCVPDVGPLDDVINDVTSTDDASADVIVDAPSDG